MLAHFKLVLTEEGKGHEKMGGFGFSCCINSNLSEQLEKLYSIMIFQFSFKRTSFFPLKKLCQYT